MATSNPDWFDFALAGFFTLATAVTVGIATVQLFNVSFSDSLFTLQQTKSQITVATVISLGILGLMVLTNDNTNIGDLGVTDDIYGFAIAATAILIVGIPVVPQLESFVTSSDFVRSAVVGIMSVGYGAAAWIR